jgi:phosphoglycolate phosphatase
MCIEKGFKMKNYDIILFDLDGTLTDPKEGITKAFAYALKETKQLEVPLEELTKCIGPPLKTSFMTFFDYTEEECEAGIRGYRTYFEDKGWHQNILFDGIEEILKKLKANGKTLFVATSKATVYAEKIIAHFGLMPYFTAVVGSNMDGTRTHKDEVIQEVLNRLEGIKPEDVLMIGDREHDVLGAKKLGVPVIGVTFGYGSREELEKAGATAIVESMSELSEVLGV